MNGGDGRRRWKNLKQRLGFKAMGCCGAFWSLTESNMNIREGEEEEEELILGVGPIPARDGARSSSSSNVGQIPAASGMNLAAALAAERNLRAVVDDVGPITAGQPLKTLMRLIEESDGVELKKLIEEEEEEEHEKEGRRGGSDGVCCVCMERNKGAAFIPCGHTFCRVCSKDVWVNRGSCPICNRLILEILDIF